MRASRAAAGAGKKRGAQEPEDHALGRSRGGFTSKFHLVTDGHGIPLAVEVTAGQCHESKSFEEVINAIRIPKPRGRPRTRPLRLAGDKAYSIPWIRAWLRRHTIGAVIPQRKDELEHHQGRPLKFEKATYRRRHVIENCVGWLKECRRIGTRFEKTAVNFMAMLKWHFYSDTCGPWVFRQSLVSHRPAAPIIFFKFVIIFSPLLQQGFRKAEKVVLWARLEMCDWLRFPNPYPFEATRLHFIRVNGVFFIGH